MPTARQADTTRDKSVPCFNFKRDYVINLFFLPFNCN